MFVEVLAPMKGSEGIQDKLLELTCLGVGPGFHYSFPAELKVCHFHALETLILKFW